MINLETIKEKVKPMNIFIGNLDPKSLNSYSQKRINIFEGEFVTTFMFIDTNRKSSNNSNFKNTEIKFFDSSKTKSSYKQIKNKSKIKSSLLNPFNTPPGMRRGVSELPKRREKEELSRNSSYSFIRSGSTTKPVKNFTYTGNLDLPIIKKHSKKISIY
jgi:hypothetical protein